MKQGLSWWCFANRGVDNETLLAAAKEIGYEGVDLVGEDLWPAVKKAGLQVAAVGGHQSIADGLNRRENAVRIETELHENIAKAEKWEIPVLICFSGNRAGLDDQTGLEICAETLARVAPRAADAGVMLAVELLNSKVDHADYQCDTSAWGARLCEAVGSPAVKLLYDIYHMQIMEGDIIRTIQQRHAHFGHYHTAGNPGRGPIGDGQEINYSAVCRAIRATGYEGYLAHEFLPQGDPVEGLREAFKICAG